MWCCLIVLVDMADQGQGLELIHYPTHPSPEESSNPWLSLGSQPMPSDFHLHNHCGFLYFSTLHEARLAHR